MNIEDYPEILKYGPDIKNKLYNGPMYVLTLSNYEYANKKCPANYKEKIIDRGFTGKPRDLHSTLLKLSKSLQVTIYLVNVKNSVEIKQLEKKLLPELDKFGLHPGDSTFLAFAQLTKSTMITSDDRLLFSSVHAQCPKPIDFQKFLEKIMQPSPITVVLRERRNYYKHNHGWKAKR
jgi:predicted nucleic acid-binding protein